MKMHAAAPLVELGACIRVYMCCELLCIGKLITCKKNYILKVSKMNCVPNNAVFEPGIEKGETHVSPS